MSGGLDSDDAKERKKAQQELDILALKCPKQVKLALEGKSVALGVEGSSVVSGILLGPCLELGFLLDKVSGQESVSQEDILRIKTLQLRCPPGADEVLRAGESASPMDDKKRRLLLLGWLGLLSLALYDPNDPDAFRSGLSNLTDAELFKWSCEYEQQLQTLRSTGSAGGDAALANAKKALHDLCNFDTKEHFPGDADVAGLRNNLDVLLLDLASLLK